MDGFETLTKIYDSEGFFHFHIGNIVNYQTGFDASIVTHSCFEKNIRFVDFSRKVELQLQLAIKEDLKWIKNNDISYYRSLTTGEKSFLVSGIASFENNRPTLKLMSFDPIADRLEVNSNLFTTADFSPKRTFVLGERDALGSYTSSLNENIDSDVRLVKEMMALQIKSTPDKVGYPIDLLVLKAGSKTWVERQDTTPYKFQ